MLVKLYENLYLINYSYVPKYLLKESDCIRYQYVLDKLSTIVTYCKKLTILFRGL